MDLMMVSITTVVDVTQTALLLYVALLLRGAAKTLTRDLRQLMLRVAALEEKHDPRTE
jgi:hypothetical protein